MYGVSRIDHAEGVSLITYNQLIVDLGLMREVFDSIARRGVNLDMVSQTFPVGGKMNISFTCPDDDMVGVLSITKELSSTHPQLRALVSSGNCKLRLYGAEMRTEPGVFAKAMGVLAGAGIEPLLITTSEEDISLLVAPAHAETALEAFRAAFAL